MYVTSYLASGTWHLAKVTLDTQVMSHLATRVRCGPLLSPEKSNQYWISQIRQTLIKPLILFVVIYLFDDWTSDILRIGGKERKRKIKDEEYFDTRKRFIYVMQRSRQTGQRSLHWKRNFSWDIVGEVEVRLKIFKEWSQIFRIFEIVATSVRNMWRQRSPCTSGWPATLLMKSFKKNPLILSEPKLCFIKRWTACLEYITISQGITIWIPSDQKTKLFLCLLILSDPKLCYIL